MYDRIEQFFLEEELKKITIAYLKGRTNPLAQNSPNLDIAIDEDRARKERIKEQAVSSAHSSAALHPALKAPSVSAAVASAQVDRIEVMPSMTPLAMQMPVKEAKNKKQKGRPKMESEKGPPRKKAKNRRYSRSRT